MEPTAPPGHLLHHTPNRVRSLKKVCFATSDFLTYCLQSVVNSMTPQSLPRSLGKTPREESRSWHPDWEKKSWSDSGLFNWKVTGRILVDAWLDSKKATCPGNVTVDLWPDVTNLDDDERFQTKFKNSRRRWQGKLQQRHRRTVVRTL